jgi:arsenate reductase (glutaredoxin)
MVGTADRLLYFSKMPIKIYEYKNCSTCQKAIKYLESNKVIFQALPIVDQPPTMAELKKMLGYLKKDGGSFKSLFNTSGVQYRELKISDKIKAGLSEEEAIGLLSKNGKLIKRPFLLTDGHGTVGFKPEIWKKILGLK